jgi:hypothetical protein
MTLQWEGNQYHCVTRSSSIAFVVYTRSTVFLLFQMPPKKSAVKRTKDEDEVKPTKVAKKEAGGAKAMGGKDGIIAVFDELKMYEQRDGNGWAAVAYSKVSTALRNFKGTITSGADVKHLAGVGKASVSKIDEYLSSGKVDALEKLRELHGKLPEGVIAGGDKVKGKPLTKAQLAKISKKEEELDGMSIDGLKVALRANRQVTTGTKGELLGRVAEGMVLGAIPTCPLCSGGKLRFDQKTGIYKCPGYMDDDTFRPCHFKGAEVTRVAWTA